VLERRAAEARSRYAVREAMARYGSDKPDLRVKLELTDITDCVRRSTSRSFSAAAALPTERVRRCGCRTAARCALGDRRDEPMFVKIYGAKGLAYIKVNDRAKGRDGLQSPIVRTCTTRRWPRS